MNYLRYCKAPSTTADSLEAHSAPFISCSSGKMTFEASFYDAGNRSLLLLYKQEGELALYCTICAARQHLEAVGSLQFQATCDTLWSPDVHIFG